MFVWLFIFSVEQLKKIFENVEQDKKVLVSFAIDELFYMEKELMLLKRYPFMLYNKKTGETKTTSAGKRYKELQQSYLNCLKVLAGVLRNASVEEEDAFDQWIKQRQVE